MVGLAHISELADGPVKDINALFKPKQVPPPPARCRCAGAAC